jgi:hypothetical protein
MRFSGCGIDRLRFGEDAAEVATSIMPVISLHV